MTTKKFLKREAIKFGWNTTKDNVGFFVILLTIVIAFSLISNLIIERTKEGAPFLSFLMSVASVIIGIIIQMGLIKISLKFCDGEKPEFSDLLSCKSLFFKYLGGTILYGLIILGGIILFVVPGIIWAIQFFFYDYFIVDKGLGPIEALRRSSQATKGAKWDLLLFGLLLFGINLLGLLALVIGIFVSAPVGMLATAFVYRKLINQVKITDSVIGQP